MLKKDNLFIVFEGIDGCGKDTQLNNLIPHIKEDNNKIIGNKYTNIWITRENTKFSKEGLEYIKRIKEGSLNKDNATTLLIKDRVKHTKVIKKMLKENLVLCSRYDLSTLAYQHSQGQDLEYLYDLHKYDSLFPKTIIPDITFVFKINQIDAKKRIEKRGGIKDQFDKNEKFQKLVEKNLIKASNFLKKKQPKRKIIFIDAKKSIKEIQKEILGHLKV